MAMLEGSGVGATAVVKVKLGPKMPGWLKPLFVINAMTIPGQQRMTVMLHRDSRCIRRINGQGL